MKCKICKQEIKKTDLVVFSYNGQKLNYHRKCLREKGRKIGQRLLRNYRL